MRDETYYRFADAFILVQMLYDAGMTFLNLAAIDFNSAADKDVLHVLGRLSTELRELTPTVEDSKKIGAAER